MRITAGWDTCCASDVVDVYNSATGTWSTARLSLGRDRIAATSVGNVVVFAGGYVQGTSLYLWQGMILAAFAHCFLIQSAADSFSSVTAVDIFNSATGTWSTAQLSQARRNIGATSVGSVALFAAGAVSDLSLIHI